jgi:hypothetical protein
MPSLTALLTPAQIDAVAALVIDEFASGPGGHRIAVHIVLNISILEAQVRVIHDGGPSHPTPLRGMKVAESSDVTPKSRQYNELAGEIGG